MNTLTAAPFQDYALPTRRIQYAAAPAPHWAGGIGVLNETTKSRHAPALRLFLCLICPVMGGRAGRAERLAGVSPVRQSPFGRSPDWRLGERLKPAYRDTIMNIQSPVTGEFCPHVAVINGTIKTTSLKIAEHFGKQHKDVLRKIANLDCSEEFNQRNFAPVEYIDPKGEKQPCYEITRDGFMFLAMGFTGKQAAQWKEAYINAFNRMENELQGKPTPALTIADIEALIDSKLKAQQPKAIPHFTTQVDDNPLSYRLRPTRFGDFRLVSDQSIDDTNRQLAGQGLKIVRI